MLLSSLCSRSAIPNVLIHFKSKPGTSPIAALACYHIYNANTLSVDWRDLTVDCELQWPQGNCSEHLLAAGANPDLQNTMRAVMVISRPKNW